MKIILTITLCIASLIGMAQSTDENGRAIGAKPAKVVNADNGVFLKQDPSSTSSNFIVNYQLPEGISAGEIKLFDSRRDQELQSIDVTNISGTYSVNLKEYQGKSVVVALYDKTGKFIQELRTN
ncbi:hypothetical protein SAMN06298216_1182 [Spirosomataceae bacterium TFI 002]|nr:hypothetical protein SAMN06298216_1182 [Spirosomataceae bacterium TFI 002]